MKKYLTTSEVAELCHVSAGSVIRWIKEGKLNAGTTPGGHHRIDFDELTTLLRNLNIPTPGKFDEKDPAKTGPKVLIVDDELGMRDLIRDTLQYYFSDVQIEEADQGFVAGWKAHRFHPDLIILDILLPGLNGYQVCQMVKAFPQTRHTRILAISALPFDEVEPKIRELGADDFLSKPFDVDALKEKIALQLSVLEESSNG